MTEPPLFGPAAGSGPSAQGDPPAEPTPPTPPAEPGPPTPGYEPPAPAAPTPGYEPPVPPQGPAGSQWGAPPPSPAGPSWGVPEPTPVAPPQPPGPAGWTSYTPVAPPPPGPLPVGPSSARPPSGGGSRSATIGVILVVFLFVVIGGIGAYALIGSGGPTPSPKGSNAASPSGAVGVLVFSDDFHDPASGWLTETLPSGTTFKYAPGGLEVFAKGSLHHISAAPYGRARPRIAVATTATQSSPAPDGAGFGVTCDRGTGDAEIRYEFIAYADGTWTIERVDGPLSATGSPPDVLKQGTLTARPGATPLTIEGVCVTQPDGQSTKLTLFINGVQVTQITDTATTLADAGWYAELLVSSDDPPTTVLVTRFEVRIVAE